MIDKKSFWTERVRRYGHTGWSNFATYAYDQRLRLKAIAAFVGSKKIDSCLDYGCGSGDFSYLLSTVAKNITAFDISEDVIKRAKNKNHACNIKFTNDLDAVFEERYDLILSVTVLQHIVDDEELKILIEKFYQITEQDGRVIVLETFAEVESDMGYFKLRRISDFINLFNSIGFFVLSNTGFYHPTHCPTENYLKYKNNFLIRLLAKLTSLKIFGCLSALKLLSKKYSEHDSEFLEKSSSPTRIIVFQKK